MAKPHGDKFGLPRSEQVLKDWIRRDPDNPLLEELLGPGICVYTGLQLSGWDSAAKDDSWH